MVIFVGANHKRRPAQQAITKSLSALVRSPFRSLPVSCSSILRSLPFIYGRDNVLEFRIRVVGSLNRFGELKQVFLDGEAGVLSVH